MNEKIVNIAIDGPSGAGKSTIAKAIARELGILYLDTGAMYRAIAWIALDKGINPNDNDAVERMLNSADISIKYSDGKQLVFAGDKDITTAIREHHMSKAASDISKIHAVRNKLVEMQRNIAKTTDMVLDGRDITSNVLPKAKYKFYLDASAEIRTERRLLDLKAKGDNIVYKELLEDIIERDYNDMNRDYAPLIRTEDSIYIDTSNMTFEEVQKAVLQIIKG